MRRTWTIPTLLAALLATMLTACGGAPMAASAPTEAPAATAAPAMGSSAGGEAGGAPVFSEVNSGLETRPDAVNQGGTDSAAPGAQPAQPAAQRLVIKNAEVSLEVADVSDAEARIRARAEQLGGYVVSASTSGSGEYLSTAIVFRVPADRFEDALSGVEGLARRVLSRSVGGQDVTEEFVDLGSRLRNLEATRDRLLDLLGRATRVEDALQVNQALTDVQGEIEQIQGRRQYLQQSAAFSTITAQLTPVPPPPTIIEENGWQPLAVAARALRGLVAFGQDIASMAIVVLVWTPVWLPLLLLALWVRRRYIRGPRPTPPAPPAPSA